MNYKFLLASLLPFAAFSMEIEKEEQKNNIKMVSFPDDKECLDWLNQVNTATLFNRISTVEQLLSLPIAKVHIPATFNRQKSSTALINYCLLFSIKTWWLCDKNSILPILNSINEFDIYDTFGYSPLYYACNFALDSQLIKFLIQKGCSVNASQNTEGYSPLHVATRPEIIDMLIRAGATLELKDVRGSTPLLRQAYWYQFEKNIALGPLNHYYETLVALISHGADINAIDNHNGSLKTFVGKDTFNKLLHDAEIEKNKRELSEKL